MFNKVFFFENHAFCETTCKAIVELGWPQVTLWRMCIAWWIPKPTHTRNI